MFTCTDNAASEISTSTASEYGVLDRAVKWAEKPR